MIEAATDMVRGGGLVTPSDAALRGVDGADLRAAHVAGALVRVRRGVYASAEGWQALTPEGRYRLSVRAAARTMARPLFCHDSAAVLWGLPRVGPWPRDVHIVVPHEIGGRSGHGVVRHRATSPPHGVVELDGVNATCASRTIVDLAGTRAFSDVLASADHALRAGWTTPDDLNVAVVSLAGTPGVRAARRVLAAADGRAESVGESLSRARMVELGLPRPELQQEFSDCDGFVARVDFWWPAIGVVGEFDGRVKYRVEGVGDPRLLEERLWAEKAREDRLRGLGLTVVRWTWDVAMDHGLLARRLATAGLRTP